jgi:hypothetical protein
MADDEVKVILPFPQARVRPARTVPALDLGCSRLARRLDLAPLRLSGHWCSRCQGIWRGLLLETECPSCGNRRG